MKTYWNLDLLNRNTPENENKTEMCLYFICGTSCSLLVGVISSYADYKLKYCQA